MRTDKDKPWTWVKFREELCNGCYGSCCTMPVEVRAEDLIRLGLATQDELDASPKKVAKRLMKSGEVATYREGTGLFQLTQQSNDDCYYLDSKTRLCKVYESRPDVCRQFPSIGPRPGFCPHRKNLV